MSPVNLKTRLRTKIPRIYGLAKNFYYRVRKILESKLLGSKFQELAWQNRSLYKKDWHITHWARGFEERKILTDKMILEAARKYGPINSALEVGCGTGVQLYNLLKLSPQTKFYGVDINKRAILYGKKKLKELGVSNIDLNFGPAHNLRQFGDKSIDALFTIALLLYIGPDKIKKTAGEFLRVAKNAVIFVEQNAENRPEDPNGLGVYHNGNWARNYKDLIASFGVPAKKIKITKLPAEINGSLEEPVSLIEVDLAGPSLDRRTWLFPLRSQKSDKRGL